MSEAEAQAARRLRVITSQLRPETLSLAAREKDAKAAEHRGLSALTKLTVSLVPPTAVYYLLCALRKRQPHPWIPVAIASYSQAMGLIGVKDWLDELKSNLGIRSTLSKDFQLFNVVGSLVYTASQTSILSTHVGRIMFAFNVVYTLVYGYMLYLTLRYNRELAADDDAGAPGHAGKALKRSVPALSVWLASLLFTASVWWREAGLALREGKRSEIFSVLGFLLSAFGTYKAGLSASLHSKAEIAPFNGAVMFASAVTLGVLSLVPMWATNRSARIYLSGYVTTIISVLINARFAPSS